MSFDDGGRTARRGQHRGTTDDPFRGGRRERAPRDVRGRRHHLAGRGVRRLRGRDDAHSHPRLALRHRRLRGRSVLRHGKRPGHLPLGGATSSASTTLAKVYDIEIPFELEELSEATLELIHREELQSCYIRPIAYYGYGPLGLNPEKSPVETAIAVWPWGAYLGEEALEEGVDVAISSWRKHASSQIPTNAKTTGAYVNSVLASLEAKGNSYTGGHRPQQGGQRRRGAGREHLPRPRWRDSHYWPRGVHPRRHHPPDRHRPSPRTWATPSTTTRPSPGANCTPRTNCSSPGRPPKSPRSAPSTTTRSVPARRDRSPTKSRHASSRVVEEAPEQYDDWFTYCPAGERCFDFRRSVRNSYRAVSRRRLLSAPMPMVIGAVSSSVSPKPAEEDPGERVLDALVDPPRSPWGSTSTT